MPRITPPLEPNSITIRNYMNKHFVDKRLERIFEKLQNRDRLNHADGVSLYHSQDLIGIGRLADMERRRRHGRAAYYVYNQHLNYTNVCSNRCRFCAYAKNDDEKGAFTLSLPRIRKLLAERGDEPVQEIHMVGGINPALPFDYYVDLIKTIRTARPHVTIKAFTAVEIDHLARISGHSLEETIGVLKNAGLAMLPGGGAEILNSRIRKRLFPRKIDFSRWLEIMEAVHAAGLTSNATMLYGHIESPEERVDHLLKLRALQDNTGGFSAFIPLAFHSGNTELDQIPATTAFNDLKNIAVSRLMLDNFEHIKAYWVMIGEKLAQVALSFGADDLDGTIIEEKISHTAGAKSAKGLTPDEMEDLIKGAGFIPVERDSFYHPIHA